MESPRSSRGLEDFARGAPAARDRAVGRAVVARHVRRFAGEEQSPGERPAELARRLGAADHDVAVRAPRIGIRAPIVEVPGLEKTLELLPLELENARQGIDRLPEDGVRAPT